MTQNKQSLLFKALIYSAAGIVAFVSLSLVLYIMITGLPNINKGLFAFQYNSDNASLFPALINTLVILALSLSISVPLGLGSAVYLTEYSNKNTPASKLICITAQTLQSIPSIIYGLFGLMLFVTAFKWQFSIMAGAVTLSIMILPTIMRTCQEALLLVPNSLRQGGQALGATKLYTIVTIVFPVARPAIINGIILATGRVIGESAALIYTAGTVAKVPKNLFSSGRTLSVHLYCLMSEGIKTSSACGVAAFLVLFVVVLSIASRLFCRQSLKSIEN